VAVESKLFRDEELKNEKVFMSLKKLEYLNDVFGRNADGVFREFRLGGGNPTNAVFKPFTQFIGKLLT
jgi:hypothetical protein